MIKTVLQIIFYTIVFSSLSYAITIDDDKKIYNSFEVKYLNDKNSKLSIQNISKKKFIKATQNNFNLGYKKGTVWLKFTVENNFSINNFILTLNESFYEKANLYYHDNQWIKKTNGVFNPIEKREIKINHLAFDLMLKDNEKKVFYLELKGKYAYFGNLEFYEKSYFYFDNTVGINSLYIFILGIIFVIINFNLFLYIKTKEKIYLYYSGYSFFNFIYLLNISGLLVYIDLQKYIYQLHLSSSFTISFLILFSMEYLETKKYLSNYHKILKCLSIPFFILGILVLFSYQPWNKFINNFAGILCMLLITISIIVYLKGHRKTKYYIFAMVLYFVFLILFTFMVNGIFEYSNFTRYGFIIASSIEVTIFSLMLANRYNEIKENMQHNLEVEVKNRTNTLSALLNERELLLKEVYHRVKNNFHIVIGILSFETNKHDDPKQFNELINRIKSMSLVHDYLYKTEDISNIDANEYLNKIINNIFITQKNIKLNHNITNTTIEFDDAVSLGIIVNEILTNSIKHNSNINLVINIDLKKQQNTCVLTITDNGSGFDTHNKYDGLGLKLVKQFCKKLPNSKCCFSNNHGTEFQVTFFNNKKVL